MKCIVHNCENELYGGGSDRNICPPCWKFITTGDEIYSQVYRNAIAAQVADRMEIKPDPKESIPDGAIRYNINTQTAETYVNKHWIPVDLESVGIKAKLSHRRSP